MSSNNDNRKQILPDSSCISLGFRSSGYCSKCTMKHERLSGLGKKSSTSYDDKCLQPFNYVIDASTQYIKRNAKIKANNELKHLGYNVSKLPPDEMSFSKKSRFRTFEFYSKDNITPIKIKKGLHLNE